MARAGFTPSVPRVEGGIQGEMSPRPLHDGIHDRPLAHIVSETWVC